MKKYQIDEGKKGPDRLHYHFDSRPRFTEKTIVLIIILAVILTGSIGVCSMIYWRPPLVDETPAWDSTIIDHSRIPDNQIDSL